MAEIRRPRDGDGAPDNARHCRWAGTEFAVDDGIEAKATDTDGAQMRKRVRGSAPLVAVIGGMQLRSMVMQAVAEVADHVRQRHLLPGQQVDKQPCKQQELAPGLHERSRAEHPAHVPRTSNSTSPRRKPRGNLGGGGGSALRQNTPPQSVQRKWM